ncbi:phosphatase PAP2 family protein [Clostridium sp. 19966]|uniref:phosphatase PAP2 family protein n=1 Tax=Clostridium sp. 19966 TaxID=2768166 RepID=UPI0028E05618|nr:phosphatase PAP2 family protein [Clostridium sp. 19966]MDT8715724.1 phosphatase PAP2 family protein [Clostridium sp. 19966]
MLKSLEKVDLKILEYMDKYLKSQLLDIIMPLITYSFPSGHSAASFAAAGIFVAMNGWSSVIVIILAILIGFSRLYLKVHYPLDVLSGMFLGILCSSIIVHISKIIRV